MDILNNPENDANLQNGIEKTNEALADLQKPESEILNFETESEKIELTITTESLTQKFVIVVYNKKAR